MTEDEKLSELIKKKLLLEAELDAVTREIRKLVYGGGSHTR